VVEVVAAGHRSRNSVTKVSWSSHRANGRRSTTTVIRQIFTELLLYFVL